MTISKFKLYDGKDPRNLPAYTRDEASRYTGVPVKTLQSWVSGRAYPTGSGRKISKPLILLSDRSSSLLSFTNLIEAHVLNAIRRKHSVSMPKVRKALDYLGKEFGPQSPLAEIDFETDGVDLFVEHYGNLINASSGGQLAMRDILKVYRNRIERDENGIARQLFPFTRHFSDAMQDSPEVVAINPRIAFGKPVIVGTGIPTFVIAERYKTGESIAELADDYRRQPFEVEEAIRCEFELKAA